jgi:hypothetical protein
MSGTICAAKGSPFERKREEITVQRSLSGFSAQKSHRWMTKQVIAACLWSAFFGLLAGYSWMFLHVSQERALPGNGYKATIASSVDSR